MKFIVVTDGAGEDRLNWNVVEVEALDPAHAVEIVTRPEQGYGDKLAIVVKAEDARVFQLVERIVPEALALDRITERTLHRV